MHGYTHTHTHTHTCVHVDIKGKKMECMRMRRCYACGSIDNMLWYYQSDKNRYYCGACHNTDSAVTSMCRCCRNERPLPFLKWGEYESCLQCYRKGIVREKECHKQAIPENHRLTQCEECLKPGRCIIMSDSRSVCNYCFYAINVREQEEAVLVAAVCEILVSVKTSPQG